MRKSINAGYFARKLNLPFDEVFSLIREIGFDSLDISPPCIEVNCAELSAERTKQCEKYGLEIFQTHGPFNRYGTYGSEMPVVLERSYEGTKIMGAKYFVVHGDEYDMKLLGEYTPEKALQYNYELYAPYVERAEKDGISIAFETVFNEGYRFPRYCAEFDELAGLIAKFNSDNVCCCWDFGHANVAFGAAQYDNMRKMGSLLKCTHIHDNNGKADQHLMPFYGNINWKEYNSVLNEIGYSGTLSLEIGVTGEFPQTFLSTVSKYAYDTLVCIENL